MDERTTGELIVTLGDDIDRCFRELDCSFEDGEWHADGTVDADYEYHARQLIRAVFAFIEAVTFSVKVKAAEYCLEHGRDISDAERFFACDLEYALKDTGEVYERAAHIKLTDNIRFAFALQEKALGITQKFDANVEWWACLKSSIKVRDRLTHPKLPEHVDVSGDEIIKALKAYNGFKGQAMAYANMRGVETRE